VWPADRQHALTADAGTYIGRFAPSPTGPLHFGSLLAAAASFAEARANHGYWFVRIEDIDPPREVPGADRQILEVLEACGMQWDGEVTYQSQFVDRHLAAVTTLLECGLAYPCSCSRRDLAGVPRGPLGAIYPGTCRQGAVSDDVAIRVRTTQEPVEFTDRLQGPQCQRLESVSGDFVIRRRDGLMAYHLAVFVDDFDQGITEVVRGIDLLDSTPRHIWLQRLLGLPTPSYAHVPIAVAANGEKLSKSTGASGIDLDKSSEAVFSALLALGQQPPAELAGERPEAQWQWAIANWNPAPLAGVRELQAARFGY